MFPRLCPCFHVLVHVSMSLSMCPRPCFKVLVHVSMSLSMSMSMFSSSPMSMSIFMFMSIFMSPYCKQKPELTEKRQIPFVCCKRKRKFVLLGRQAKNVNRRLMCQQTCPSMLITHGVRTIVATSLLPSTASPIFQELALLVGWKRNMS
jgi:hypothetical protein